MSRPEPDFVMQDLLDELLATPADDEGWRVEELMDALREGDYPASEKTVRRRMRRLDRQGKLFRGWRWITDIAGRRMRVPVYRLKADDG